jgi:hypothetical protein
MAFVFFPNPHLMPTSPVFGFLMQLGMIVGYFTSGPANAWLIRRGIKEGPHALEQSCRSSTCPRHRCKGASVRHPHGGQLVKR